jgi:hypothetical protein
MTAAECNVAADRLESVVIELRSVLSLKTQEIWVFRKRSLDVAIERAESFQQELKRSINAIRAGEPFDEESDKTRRPRQKMNESDKAMIAKPESVNVGKQSKQIKAPNKQAVSVKQRKSS